MFRIESSSPTHLFHSLCATDNALVPSELQTIFDRVRQSADYMPKWQVEVWKACRAYTRAVPGIGCILPWSTSKFILIHAWATYLKVRVNMPFPPFPHTLSPPLSSISPLSPSQRTIVQELGEDWRERFAEFEDRPIAAASIGQVRWCARVALQMSRGFIENICVSPLTQRLSLLATRGRFGYRPVVCTFAVFLAYRYTLN